MSIAHMYNAPIPVLDLKDSVIGIHLLFNCQQLF